MERVGESSSSASSPGLPSLSVNYVSFLCKFLSKSIRFYEQILGFVLIQRPASFHFQGAWLFNYGVGIHLLESERAPEGGGAINPKDNHISFQCSNVKLVTQKLDGSSLLWLKMEEFRWINSSSTTHGRDLRLPKPPCSPSQASHFQVQCGPLSLSSQLLWETDHVLRGSCSSDDGNLVG